MSTKVSEIWKQQCQVSLQQRESIHIPASFRIFLSRLWHCKKWSDGWDRKFYRQTNHTDTNIYILFTNDCSQYLMIINQFQAMLEFYMDIPKNIRNNFDFLLSGVYSENDGLKWVNLYNYKLLVLKKFYFMLFSSS